MQPHNDLLASTDAARERAKNPFREVGVVLVEDAMGRVLLVRTRKLPVSWQPIGGGKDPIDLSLLATAIRELREEAGLSLSAADLHFILETPFDFGQGKVQFFHALLPAAAEPIFDTEEIAEARWATLDEATLLPVFPATKTCILHLLEQRAIRADEV